MSRTLEQYLFDLLASRIPWHLGKRRRSAIVRFSTGLVCAALILATPLGLLAQHGEPAPEPGAGQSLQPAALQSTAGESTVTSRPEKHRKPPVESEIILEGFGSFGHFHIFANSWWSSLYLGGVEYDRHSWGEFLKARMDYVAEFQPVVILKQPSKTDVWGNPLSTARELTPGLGFSPIGLRMIWRDSSEVKPYFIVKGGLIGFTQKALSHDGAYANMSLQIGLGAQFHLHDRWDMRMGYSDFHFSDAFIVPSNPGLDSMVYTGGLSYHLGERTRSR